MNTYNILNNLKKQLRQRDIHVDIINLFDYDIKECTGCEQCLRGKVCIHKDHVNLLMDKLKEYDGFILSTPIYMGGVSGKLKVFIDRTCRWFHRPELVGRPVLHVATTSASGLKETLRFLEKTSVQWGAFPCGSIGRTVSNLSNAIQTKEYDNFIKHLFMEKKDYAPTLNQLIFFQVQKVLAEKILTVDREYWEDKKWFNKLFYFQCRINVMNKGIAKGFHRMLSKKVVKVGE
jgi:multimeric flavodoxin WrbA